MYLLEVEELGAAYEDLKVQNERLLLQIKEKEEYATRLLTDSIRIEQSQRRAELNLSDHQKRLEVIQMRRIFQKRERQRRKVFKKGEGGSNSDDSTESLDG